MIRRYMPPPYAIELRTAKLIGLGFDSFQKISYLINNSSMAMLVSPLEDLNAVQEVQYTPDIQILCDKDWLQDSPGDIASPANFNHIVRMIHENYRYRYTWYEQMWNTHPPKTMRRGFEYNDCWLVEAKYMIIDPIINISIQEGETFGMRQEGPSFVLEEGLDMKTVDYDISAWNHLGSNISIQEDTRPIIRNKTQKVVKITVVKKSKTYEYTINPGGYNTIYSSFFGNNTGQFHSGVISSI